MVPKLYFFLFLKIKYRKFRKAYNHLRMESLNFVTLIFTPEK